jgi:hypothetical protein
VGKSREVVTRLWTKISAEKAAYNTALAEYKVNHRTFSTRSMALMDMLNPAKLDHMLASTAKSIEDSWTTVGLQRGMRELVRLMSDDFESVFVASEDIKKLMQGVYNTFTTKFGFQPMVIPALDLELNRAKLKLLVVDTDAFAKDPVNVLAMEKSFLVKKFYRTLVNQARAIFSDARTQSERWTQAVVLPLETQIKEHKQQLQSRLDNLSKINEKSTGINEQLAELRTAAEALRKQREMIDGLLQRVSRDEPLSVTQPLPSLVGQKTEPLLPAGFLEAEVPTAAEAPLTITRRAARAQEVFREVAHVKEEPLPVPARPAAPRPAAPAAPAAAPLISDDMLAAFAHHDEPGKSKGGAPNDAEKTQRLPAFDPRRLNPDGSQKAAGAQPAGADRTQRLDLGHDETQRLDLGHEETQRLDFSRTQILDLPDKK